MKNILVLTDFSKCANNAVRYAIKLREAYDVNLVFYHSTYRYFLAGMPESYITEIIKDYETDACDMLKTNITKIFQALKTSPGKSKFIANYGTHLTEKIEEIIKQEKIDMIIMGTQGASGLDRVLFGSNTAKIIDVASCPVLSIPPNKRFKELKKIMLFSDLSELKEELSDVIPVVKKFKCRLEICHLSHESNKPDASDIKVVEAMKGRYKYADIRLSVVRRQYDKSLVEQIEMITSKQKPDMICLHTLKYGWLEKLIAYSYTKNLVYHSQTSILTFSKRAVYEPILI